MFHRELSLLLQSFSQTQLTFSVSKFVLTDGEDSFFFFLLLQNIPKHKLSTTVHKSSSLISELTVAIGLFQLLQPDSAQWNEISNLPIVSCFQVTFSSVQFSSVQSLSHVQLFVTPWIAACQASLSITISQSSLKLMSIESMMPSSHLILCCPCLLLPPIPPNISVFSNESALYMTWPKYWS